MEEGLLRGGDRSMNSEQVTQVDWAVVESLIQAQANTNTSLEQYLLYVTHNEFDLDEAEMEQCLSEAIVHHERALEDLEAARQLVVGSDD